ncbi:MAG: alpha/beta hydrolase-fold protein [Bacteroidia bacterium]|nr:alpha/beta hydrolase-fold protein [Bacteroidia bacterium]
MKSIKYLIILATLLVLFPPVARAAGTVDDYRFFSKALNREMTCRIYLPGDYRPLDPDKRFPVIYFLHGATLGFDTYDPLFTILENLIFFRIIKPVILVMPDGLAPPYDGSFYTNSALYGNYEDYISHDLIAFVDSAFHTKNERGKRAILGVSMGGYGALKVAFKHQDQFIGVVGHSGPVNTSLMDRFIPELITEDGGTAPFHWSPGSGKSLTNLTFTMAGAFSPNLSKPYQVDFPLDSLAKPIPEVWERWKAENICEIAKAYHPGTNLGIKFDCGNLDEYDLYYQNRSLADTLTKYNIPFKYDEYIGTHTSGLPVRAGLSLTYLDLLFETGTTGSPLAQTGSNWEIFPNPASNNLTICNNNYGPYLEKQVFQLADAMGRVVENQILIDGINRINITNLPAGLYFFKIQCGDILQTGTTIIVH